MGRTRDCGPSVGFRTEGLPRTATTFARRLAVGDGGDGGDGLTGLKGAGGGSLGESQSDVTGVFSHDVFRELSRAWETTSLTACCCCGAIVVLRYEPARKKPCERKQQQYGGWCQHGPELVAVSYRCMYGGMHATVCGVTRCFVNVMGCSHHKKLLKSRQAVRTVATTDPWSSTAAAVKCKLRACRFVLLGGMN
jgi:hypothetical protein